MAILVRTDDKYIMMNMSFGVRQRCETASHAELTLIPSHCKISRTVINILYKVIYGYQQKLSKHLTFNI